MTTTAPVYIVDDDPSVREAVGSFRNQQGAAPSVVLR